MKKTIFNIVFASALMLAFLPSCKAVKNSNKTQRGAVVGTLGGAALGALIGGKDNRVLGAVIGGAVGGVTGGVIGNKMDKQAEEIQNSLPGAEVKRVGEGIQVVLDESSKDGVKFTVNSAEINAQSSTTINKLLPIFKEYGETNILIVGHTDSSGSDEYNMTLSKKRADKVKEYLVSKYGISSQRLTSVGKGETEPKVSNDTEAGRIQNRRVEFIITANEKMIEEAKKEAAYQ